MSTDAARHLNRATRQISRRRADVQRLPARLLIVTLVSPACCVVLVTVFSFSKDRSRRSSPVAAHARSSTVASRQGRSRKGGQQGGDGALRLLESCHASRQPELAGRSLSAQGLLRSVAAAFSCGVAPIFCCPGRASVSTGPCLFRVRTTVHWHQQLAFHKILGESHSGALDDADAGGRRRRRRQACAPPTARRRLRRKQHRVGGGPSAVAGERKRSVKLCTALCSLRERPFRPHNSALRQHNSALPSLTSECIGLPTFSV